MQPTTLYARIASALEAQANCDKTGNAEWRHLHVQTIVNLVREFMPSGSGFDSGTTLDFATSDKSRLTFATSFHHMHDSGMYDGWTEHGVVITASLAHGIDMRITGRDRNGIKDYIAECFDAALRRVLTDEECGHCYARPNVAA
jgi:hypothetical protein